MRARRKGQGESPAKERDPSNLFLKCFALLSYDEKQYFYIKNEKIKMNIFHHF